MTLPPPRKRFQIHLSTAIVMMFVAGVLIWANVRPREITLREETAGPRWIVDNTYRLRGWPLNVTSELTKYKMVNPQLAFLTVFAELHVNYWLAAVDAAIGIMILLVAWFGMEYMIRRFQIHLLTAIVMMFVAGGLIWVNIEDRPIYHPGGTGWPISYMWRDNTNAPTVELLVVLYDLAFGLAILFAIWFLCERLIRRRAARLSSPR